MTLELKLNNSLLERNTYPKKTKQKKTEIDLRNSIEHIHLALRTLLTST